MTARSIRRSQERKAKKLARKQSNELAVVATAPAEIETAAAPETAEGKAQSSINALNALTGRTVLLPSDDAAAYEQYVERFVREFQPVGIREAELVQSIADANWCFRRHHFNLSG